MSNVESILGRRWTTTVKEQTEGQAVYEKSLFPYVKNATGGAQQKGKVDEEQEGDWCNWKRPALGLPAT